MSDNTDSSEYNHKIKELEQINLILKDLMKKEESSQSKKDDSLEIKIKELESAGIISEEFIKNFQVRSKDYTKEMVTDLHDKLRTPLVPIIGYTDMMLSEEFGNLNSEQAERIKHVNSNAKILHKILEGMLEEKR